MPQGVYRWEEKGALVHHCPVCHSPLAAEKARTTCLGKHVEWCSQYHTQLFKMGHSRKCMACCKAEKEQAKRHREIAEFVRQVHVTAPTSPPPPDDATRPSPRKGWVPPDKSLTKEARKARKKATRRAEGRPLVASHAEVEAVIAVLREAYARDEEAESDVRDDVTIRQNVAYHRGNCNTKAIRREVIGEGRVAAEESGNEPTEGELDALVGRLHGEPGRSGEVGERLREAVRKDAVTIGAERRETMMRKAGFWRWANRKAYLRLVEHGREWDDKDDVGRREATAGEEVEGEGYEEGERTVDEVKVSPSPVTPTKENVAPVWSTAERTNGGRIALCGNGGLRKLSVALKRRASPYTLLADFYDEEE